VEAKLLLLFGLKLHFGDVVEISPEARVHERVLLLWGVKGNLGLGVLRDSRWNNPVGAGKLPESRYDEPQWLNHYLNKFCPSAVFEYLSFRDGRMEKTGSKGLWDWGIGVSKSRSQVDLSKGNQA